MQNRKFSVPIAALIIAVTLPGAAALFYYQFTGDPTMQPLGITLSKLAEHETTGRVSGIVAEVEWGRAAKTPNTKEEVNQALQQALAVYGIDYRVRFIDRPGDRIIITFVAGANRFGPYHLANAASGIAPALAAFHLTEKPAP